MIQSGRKFIPVAYVGTYFGISSYTADSHRLLPIYTVVYNYCLLSQLQTRMAIGRRGHVTRNERERVCVLVSVSLCRTYPNYEYT